MKADWKKKEVLANLSEILDDLYSTTNLLSEINQSKKAARALEIAKLVKTLRDDIQK